MHPVIKLLRSSVLAMLIGALLVWDIIEVLKTLMTTP